MIQDFQMDPDTQNELIDTAIVIKNIPFSYPEEDFVGKLFPQLRLVPPHAFNYHRNKSDRMFRGLAFANFNTANEAQAAIDGLNNYELYGRRLRVELKKRLSAEEEQRQRLARQSKRQLAHQTTSSTGFLEQTIQSSQSMEDIPTNLNPALRPRIIHQEYSTPTSEIGVTTL
jgi:RNA recognition motif-containing protein